MDCNTDAVVNKACLDIRRADSILIGSGMNGDNAELNESIMDSGIRDEGHSDGRFNFRVERASLASFDVTCLRCCRAR